MSHHWSESFHKRSRHNKKIQFIIDVDFIYFTSNHKFYIFQTLYFSIRNPYPNTKQRPDDAPLHVGTTSKETMTIEIKLVPEEREQSANWRAVIKIGLFLNYRQRLRLLQNPKWTPITCTFHQDSTSKERCIILRYQQLGCHRIRLIWTDHD